MWFSLVGDHARDVERLSRDCLSPDERKHLDRYRSGEAAERYVVTRSLVRLVLSERLRLPARDILVSRTDAGKPVVAEGIHFNVSHSGDLILLALSEQRDVGIDVERRRPVSRVERLIERWLTAEERAELGALTTAGVDVSDAFLRVWSLKEARLKALGVGISGASRAPLDRVDVLPLDQLLGSLTSPRDQEGYVGALAFA